MLVAVLLAGLNLRVAIAARTVGAVPGENQSSA